MDKDEIEKLLRSIERYNPSNLDVLTTYLKRTCEDGSYDIEAYLAVLKLYQFNPGRFDLPTTRTILLKAITNLPSNDFTLCLYLLPEQHHETAEIGMLIEIYRALEQCRFDDVWDYLAQERDMLQAQVRIEKEDGEFQYESVEITGFEDSIRNFVAYIIDSTYQVADAALIGKMLGGIKGAELEKFVVSRQWRMADGGSKIFVKAQEEVVQSKNIIETLSFESLIPIMTQGK